MIAQLGTLEDEMRGKYLTFAVDNGNYGIEIKYVTDIIAVQEITPVPNTHNYLKGLINLRGTVVPIIDMRLRFGLPEIPYTQRTCFIVLSLDEMTIGLIVEEVQEVCEIPDASIKPPPKMSGAQPNNYFIRSICETGGNIKQLLDVEKVFGAGARLDD